MTGLDNTAIIKALLSCISFLALVGICFLLLVELSRRLRVRREREHPISIHHKANFRAFYYLAVEAPQQPALRFRLMAGNLPLVEVSQPAVDVEAAAPSAKATKVTGKPAKTANLGSSSSNPAQQRMADSGSKAMVKVGALANILGLVALIPGPLGAGARQRQQELRQLQINAAKVAQAPKQAQQRLEVLQAESKKLGVKPAAGGKQASVSSPSAVTVSDPVPQAEQVASSAGSASADTPRVNPVQHPFSGFYCVQTVELDPEQTLPLKLIISPATRRSPVGSFAYNIHLQAVPIEHFQEKLPDLVKRGTVHYASVAVWHSFIPGFAAVFVILLALLFWFSLLDVIWK